MKTFFSDKTANSIWQKAVKELSRDCNNMQESRLGQSLELIHASFNIQDPRQRWVYSRMPAINPAFAIAEVVWILSGQQDANFLNFWNPSLPKYSGNGSVYHGAYGFRLREHFGIDQITRCYQVLSSNSASRQVVLQIWDPTIDLPNSDGTPSSEDIPCNICSIVKIRDGKLEWLQIMRSNDLFRGTPYNIVQFTMLQEVIAGWLNIEIGEYFQVSDSLHIYESDNEMLSVDDEIYPSQFTVNKDDLRLPKQEFDKMFPAFLNDMQCLCSPGLSIEKFRSICQRTDIAIPYKNLLCIAAADSARRRKWSDEVVEAREACKNKHLVFMWDRWEHRKKIANSL